MSVIRVGTSSKYATGWDAVFGGSKSSRAPGKSAAKQGAGKKASLKKVAVKPKTKAKVRKKSRRG